jgi:SEC-C motif-containing protein
MSVASDSRRVKKIGRNDPCPCGSGKKFKRCCIKNKAEELGIRRQQPPPPEVIEKAMQIFAQQRKEESERKVRFGEVRPVMAINVWGKKRIVVGSSIYTLERGKFFSDFLFHLVPEVFGPEWVDAETAKADQGDVQDLHLVSQWRLAAHEYMMTQPLQEDGSRRGVPNGAMAAYLAFAYDLYIVADNSRLDDLLLHRLKNRELFQGARHELFAEATCLRGGFTIEPEDEQDGSRRHAEFMAMHKSTGQRISVEAKSKHRAGVLATPGNPEPHDRLSLRFTPLINDAVRKNPPHPLVIFVDTNLPFRAADRLYRRERNEIPSRLMSAILDRVEERDGRRDPYAMIVFTNHPHHYAAKDEKDPQKHLLSVLPEAAQREVNREALMALHQAALLYGNIPNEFPD